MLTKSTGFARYSKTLCWIVAVICVALAGLSFTGDSGSTMGILWLAVAVAFAVSALTLGRSSGSDAAPAEEAGD